MIVAISLGIFGYILEAQKFPVVTIVLGIILGPIIEENTRLALALSANDWSTFVDTLPRQVMVATIVILVAYEIYKAVKERYPRNELPDYSIPSGHSHERRETK